MEYNVAYNFFLQTLPETRKYCVPLYRMVGAPRRPEFVGSPVYSRFGPVTMLLSAGHVFKAILPDRPWYPFSWTEFRELPCEQYSFPKQEEEDVAVAVLTQALPIWSPIPEERFSTFNPDDEFQHILIGYPGSSTKGSTPGAQRIEIKGYLTNAAPAEDCVRLGVDPIREFAVSFRKENVHERDLKEVTFPNPNGMSGGAVLQFHESNAKIQLLVGLMTRWDVSRKRAIVATRIESITNKFRVVKVNRPKVDA